MWPKGMETWPQYAKEKCQLMNVVIDWVKGEIVSNVFLIVVLMCFLGS